MVNGPTIVRGLLNNFVKHLFLLKNNVIFRIYIDCSLFHVTVQALYIHKISIVFSKNNCFTKSKIWSLTHQPFVPVT